ncbi:hypothetical protein C0995_012378 [Termitomyces sp. Mi166|nr:hypothetical protein C0995_012378 [Termitomyces sp. Mi166\
MTEKFYKLVDQCVSAIIANGASRNPEFETIQLHGGQEPDPATNARAVPVYASTSFVFNSSTDVFEKRMAQLEGGVAAVATSSGQAAQFLAIGAIASAGDNIVSSTQLYGGTYNQFKVTFKNFGIGCHFVEGSTPEAFAAAIDDKTKAIYIEAIANPGYIMFDIPALAKFTVPQSGSVAMEQLLAELLLIQVRGSKHTIWIFEMTLETGKFDWRASGKFPAFTEPAEGYHDMILSDKFGAVAYAVKVRAQLLRDIGPALNPFGAFLLLQGLETLSMRAERHSTNGLALAQWLEKHPHVAWVSYIGLESHPSHEIAKKQFRSGLFGGMLSFGIKGDVQVASKFVDNLKLASHLPNVGDAKTLVIHPASTTHSQLNAEEQLQTGVTPDLIRISTGLEAISDIIADLEGAFAVVFGQ